MLQIDTNGNILVNRGDTFEIPLMLKNVDDLFDTTPMSFKAKDIINLHITAPNMPWECPIIEKSITCAEDTTADKLKFNFEHEDTCKLFPETYFYEIKLQRQNEEVDENPCDDYYKTLTSKRKFILM